MRSLIAPTVIPPDPSENNILDLRTERQNILQHGRQNPGAGISIDENAGINTGRQAIKLISSSNSSDPWQLQCERLLCRGKW